MEINNQLVLNQLGRFVSESTKEGAAEISAFDPLSDRLFVVNAEENALDVLDLSDLSSPNLINSINLDGVGAGVNSVAVSNGTIAVAVANNPEQNPGVVAFFDADGNLLDSVTVGALPDMVTFTPDGSRVLVANEGEPNDDYTVDPEGSISIIDVATKEVTTASFTAFNDQQEALVSSGVRIFGPKATVAQDLEPEYIAVSGDNTTALVTLQENNAVAVVDIANSKVINILPLGFKDHSQKANSLDPSNEDAGINLATFSNLFGMYQPDAIASYEVSGQTYYVTANEGDARDYAGFSEEVRVSDLTLDPTVFPDAVTLQQDKVLGRLKTTTTLGDTDGDGDFDKIYSYGGRSFSIWDSTGNLVFDSGKQIETITANLFPNLFNSQGTLDSFDSRSDDKGAEPEGVVVGEIGGRSYAFIGLERIGGVMIYDVSDPRAPKFVSYQNSTDESGNAIDIAPEGLTFISAEDSPNGKPVLIVTNEFSNSTTIFNVDVSNTLQLLNKADQEGGLNAMTDATNFNAVLGVLEAELENPIMLSAENTVTPGPFFSVSDNVFGGAGRGDTLIQNELDFDAATGTLAPISNSGNVGIAPLILTLASLIILQLWQQRFKTK